MLILEKFIFRTKFFQIKRKILKYDSNTIVVVYVLWRKNVVNFYYSWVIKST